MRAVVISIAFLTVFGIFLLSKGCPSAAPENDASKLSDAAPSSEIARDAARRLSDAIVQELIANDRDNLFENLESATRTGVGREKFDKVVDDLMDTYGKPLRTDFKIDQVGTKSDIFIGTRPMRKFWYKVETTKFPSEKHFIFVEIVPDGARLACSGFAIAEFTQGVPEGMQ